MTVSTFAKLDAAIKALTPLDTILDEEACEATTYQAANARHDAADKVRQAHQLMREAEALYTSSAPSTRRR